MRRASASPGTTPRRVRWYRKSANAGNLQAMTALAVALLDGQGTGKDPQEAVRLLKAAADKGNVEAMYRMGGLLARGVAVEKDALEAVRLFTKAAEAGHSPAMVDLGLMFNNGQGVQVDHTKAAMWYKRAADLGNTYGMVNLGFLTSRAKASRRTRWPRSTSTGARPTKAIRPASTIWRRCTTAAGASTTRTPSRPPISCCARSSCATSSPTSR